MLPKLIIISALFTVTNVLAIPTQDLPTTTSLASLSSTLQPTGGTTPTPIPSIIPDWHGLRVPNYTVLHTQFTLPLQCSSLALPTGVLGFYSWALTLIMLYCAFVSNADESRGHCRRAYSHLLTMIFFGTMLALRIAGARVCTKQIPESTQRPKHWDASGKRWEKETLVTDYYKAAWFMITAWIAGAGFHTMIDVEHGMKTLVFVTLADVYIPAIFYNSYANFLYIDGSLWKHILAVSVPLAVSVVLLGYIVVTKLRKDKERLSAMRELGELFRIPWALLCFVLLVLVLGTVFHLWAMGMSFILLGRTINDPWGFKTAWNNFGQVMLALQGILVPAALYNALF